MKVVKSKKLKKETCKGQIYRFRISSYVAANGDIITRKTMRKLKRDSCCGCEKCDWMEEELFQQISGDTSLDNFNGFKSGAKYKLKGEWSPGSFEYPHDGDMEIVFERIPED